LIFGKRNVKNNAIDYRLSIDSFKSKPAAVQAIHRKGYITIKAIEIGLLILERRFVEVGTQQAPTTWSTRWRPGSQCKVADLAVAYLSKKKP